MLEELLKLPLSTNDRLEYLNQISKLVILDGDWVEFGVREGVSAKVLLNNLPKNNKLYLFDSFEGLPEHWGHHVNVGVGQDYRKRLV